MTGLHLTPLEQIVLLAGLQGDDRRTRIWAHPQLRVPLERLAAAGLVVPAGGKRSTGHFGGLSDPDGIRAANTIRFRGLDDLMDEHLQS